MASHLLSLLIFLFILPSKKSAAQSQSYANITLGATLSPLTQPTSWLSPSGDYAFGFRPLDSDPSRFLLAVWLAKVAGTTVVWTANGDSPVTNQAKAVLTTDGQLSLTDSKGQQVWSPNVSNARYAAMLDTGNFVLAGAGAGTMWQTFEYPTDTILPGQVLSQGAHVYAKLTDDDYSRGRFVLTLQDDGNLVLNPVAYPTAFKYDSYWSTKIAAGTDTLVFDESTGGLYLSFPNGSSSVSVFTAPADFSDSYLRATLDTDGVFRQYAYPKSSKSWVMKSSVGSDVCSTSSYFGSGVCGFNGYCTPEDGKLKCQCPPHYSFIDPDRQYKGCMPNFAAQSCEPGVDDAPFALEELVNVDWPLADAERFNPMNEADCRENCLHDCFCLVAIHAGGTTGDCWKKKSPLSNGRSLSDVSRKAFIKYSTSNTSAMLPPPAPPSSYPSEVKSDWKTWVFVVSSILGGSVILHILALISACCFLRGRKRESLAPNSSSMIGGATLCLFTYKELEDATRGFSEELGRGAFGTVYKGVLPSQARTPIAVKKLELEESMLEEAEKDFANEVATIGQTHHKNLVRLLGYCKEGAHRLLVFEFMSRGSLNKFLFGSDRPEWNRRVQIALGIAGGLAYLHEECRTQIIHCDIKPQNILLNDNLEARISDFGLAKLLRLEQTRTSTGIRGTIGYFAPEWFKNVAVTTKVDVYSFGVMLLEIVCCRRNFEWAASQAGVESQDNATVVDRAKDCYMRGRLDSLVEDDEEARTDGIRLERLVMIGISCVQDEPWMRPSMKKVVQMLEGSIAVSVPPNLFSIRA